MSDSGRWWFYALADGVFTRGTYAGPVESLARNTPPGCGAIRGVTDVLAQRVDVTRNPPVLVEYQPPPPQDTDLAGWAWDAGAKRWRDAPTLKALRRAKWTDIKAERERRVLACGRGLPYPLDTTADGRANIVSVALALMADPRIQTMRFTCADNVRREFTREAFLAAARAIAAAVQALYDEADQVRQLIAAAETPEAVASIHWP